MLMSTNSIKIAVFGSKSVGKTALVVRYLTKRFIGEYHSDSDQMYRTSRKSFTLRRSIKILDTSGDVSNKNEDEIRGILKWVNGMIVVFDICNRSSFNTAIKFIDSLKAKQPNGHQVPVALIANKCDLEAGRKVGLSECESVAKHLSATFFQVSAAENFESVKRALDACLESASKFSSICSSRQLYEVAKFSLVASPLHNIVGAVLCQKKESFSQKLIRFSRRSPVSPSVSFCERMKKSKRSKSLESDTSF